MSHTQLNQTHDREHEHEHAHTDNHDHDHHPALTSLVIDLLSDQTRTELEAVIDESLSVARFERHREGANRRQRHHDTASDSGGR